MAPAEAPVDQECVEGYLFLRSPLRLLLFRRPPTRGSIWVPVSGKVEREDRDLDAAARREVREETGFADFLEVRPLDWVVPFEGPAGGRWRLTAFAFELAREEAPRLSDEHDAFEWTGAEEALVRLHYEDNRGAVRRLQALLRGERSV